MRFDENDIRVLAICGGIIVAVVASCMGVDGVMHATAGALIGFGVAKGGVTAVRKLKVF